MRLKAVIKAFFVFFAVLTIIAAGVIGYYWATYISEPITSGYGYGFVIGDTKLETYKKVPQAFAELNPSDARIFIEIKVDNNAEKLLAITAGHQIVIETLLHEVGFSGFSARQQWEFYFKGSYRDSITLTFCGEKLCRIYRHRQYFEFP